MTAALWAQLELPMLLTAQVATRTERTLRLPGAPEAWVLATIALLVVIGVAIIYRSEGTAVPVWIRGLLGSLRVLTIAVGLLIFFQMVIAVERTERRDGQVLLLVDRSLSMSFKDKYADRGRADALSAALGEGESVEDLSRIELVKKVLLRDDGDFLRRLNRNNALRLFAFDTSLQKLTALEKGALDGPDAEALLAEVRSDLDGIRADGPETAIGDSIHQAVRGQRGSLLAGTILFSDGRSNTGTFTLDKKARDLATKEGLYAVGVGNPEPPRDIALSNLQASEVVLARDQVPFDFQVRSMGFLGPLQVRLVVDGREEASVTVDVDRMEFRTGVRLEYKPEAPGEYDVRIEADKKPGELLEENNVLTHRLKVIDEKIKVLYVDFYPRWEYRFLKTAMIRDTSMEVSCLLLDADDGFPQESSPGVAPISVFPVDREELFEYHVIVLGDVGVDSFTEEQLALLRAFVEDFGGGLLLIAGENGNPLSYARTPIEPLIPVKLDDDPGANIFRATELYNEPFHPTLTPEGRDSPILRLIEDPARNTELWEDRDGRPENSLASLYWHARVGEAKPGAKVLGYRDTPAGRVPIFSLQYYGAGRCFLSATDETWRWRSGVGDLFFYRFWGQTIRFLAGGRLHGGKRVEITTDKSEYTINDQVSVTARVYDREFKPATDDKQVIRVQRPGEDGPSPLELSAVPGQPGRYAGSLVADRIGLYELWLETMEDGAEARAGETSFTVTVPPLEYKDPKMAVEILKDAASRSGGMYYDLDEAQALPDAIGEIQEVKRVPESAPIPVWDRWWMLLIFLGLISTEWIVRKFVNLV